MMDEYLDQYFSSWSDVNANERLSWDYCEPIQQNRVLRNSLGASEDHEKNSSACVITTNHTMDGLAAKDRSSFVLDGELEFDIDKNLLSEEAQHKKDDQNCNVNVSSDGKMNGSLKLGDVGLQYDMTIPIMDSVNCDFPQQFPLVGDMTLSLPFIDVGHVVGNGNELVQRSLRDLQTVSRSPELWLPPSYDERKQELQNHPLPCFFAGPDTTMTTVELPSLHQITSAAPTGDSNGSGKPRVRARRGQATDPHSIAERLRREKISERMKNLQELIPNSNKTDKASMLDEIIDYVKFLQLQVKVLSMSRLGAAGAVLPLIADGQAEGSNCLSLSAQADQGVDTSLKPEQIAFEEEIVKLMESNVMMAMQYLQSKGLCLMPIALAAAISSIGKAFEEKNKIGVSNSSSSSNSSFPSDGTSQMSMNSNIIVGKPIRESVTGNVCNGAVKQELRNT